MRNEYCSKMKIIGKRLLYDLKNNWKLLLSLAVILILMKVLFHGICPFRLLVGFPCPGCGLTRGCLAVLTFQFRKALAYNPVSFCWVALILLWGWFRYVRGRRHPAVTAATIVVCLLTLLRYAFILSKSLA